MFYLPVGFTCLAVSFPIFVFTFLYDGSAARSSVSLALADSLLISVFPFMVFETGIAPKVPVQFQTTNSNPSDKQGGLPYNHDTFDRICVSHNVFTPYRMRFTRIF